MRVCISGSVYIRSFISQRRKFPWIQQEHIFTIVKFSIECILVFFKDLIFLESF